MNRRAIALLGRRDSPTDAVEDYCVWLGRALEAHGWTLELHRVPWAHQGWLAALRELAREGTAWRDSWILPQYTALAWSRRGLPLGFLAVLAVLARQGVRCAIVFHDPQAYSGRRPVDWLRRACQQWVMRAAYRDAARSIFTLPLDRIRWVPPMPSRATFIPVGANLPELASEAPDESSWSRDAKTIAVFGVTGGEAMLDEVRDIVEVVNRVAQEVVKLRLVLLGRNSALAAEPLLRSLNGTRVELCTLGVLPAEAVAQRLAEADAQLFVRGDVSSARGSAVAGIACGLPVAGYAGPNTAFPLTAAGVCLVPPGDRDALAAALCRVLTDEAYRHELRRRNAEAFRKHFCWRAIAKRYVEALEHG